MSRSMTPKTKPKDLPIFTEALITSSKRPSSSFYLATIISLLEISIKFNSNTSYYQTFTNLFQGLLTRVENYVISRNLNQDILSSFNQILHLLQTTADPITAFQYLSYYSESQELDSIITLEYTSRFIFAALFTDEDKVEEKVIIQDKGIRSFGRALDKICLELPINVILIEGKRKNCYQNRMSRISANVFLVKEEDRFCVLYPSECWKIMKVFPDDVKKIEDFPHVSVIDGITPLNTSLDLISHNKTENENMKQLTEIPADTNAAVTAPHTQMTNPYETTYSISSLNESILSEGRHNSVPYSEAYQPSKFDYFLNSEQNFIEEKKYENDLKEENAEKSFFYSSLSLKSVKKDDFLKYLQAIEASFKCVGLRSSFDEFCENKGIRGFDKKSMIEFFFMYLPEGDYALNNLNILALELKKNNLVHHIGETMFAQAYIMSEVDIFSEVLNKNDMGKVLVELIVSIKFF